MAHGRPAKRRRLSPEREETLRPRTVQAKDLFNSAADWDLEDVYAKKRRRKDDEPTRLPTKTLEGELTESQHRVETKVDESDVSDADSLLDNDTKEETPPTEDEPQIPIEEQINSAKEELARLAAHLNEDPEEHAGTFKKLGQIAESRTIPVKKLALATQAAVYKDVIPGYRIRAYKDEDLGTKVSKEVRQTRQYERALIGGYHSYLKQLATAIKSPETQLVAVNCACSLLLNVPHFNFRDELLDLVIRQLSTMENSSEFAKCVEGLETLFKQDEDGAASLDAVRALAKMIKTRNFHVQEAVLNTFLHLRLLSDLPAISTPTDDDERNGSKGRKQWQHRSKKERKVARERKAVAKDFREADAIVSLEERDKMQSETLKLVFVTYLRILKLRSPSLMGAVLEGLARYAHLINQDLFGDLLEALKDIAGQPELNPRETLLATHTAFTLLSNQDVSKSASALHLDLSFFSNLIHKSLYAFAVDADIELGPKSVRLADPSAQGQATSTSKVNVSTPMLLLTRALTSILLTPSSPPPTLTAIAFTKRLLTSSLHLPEKSLQALLSLLEKVIQRHGKKVEPLWYSDERKGDGVYRPESETIDGANVLSVGSGVWEEELLRQHYCPHVRDGVKSIDKLVTGLAK